MVAINNTSINRRTRTGVQDKIYQYETLKADQHLMTFRLTKNYHSRQLLLLITFTFSLISAK